MKEYLIYSILVFIPIGILLGYYLINLGFEKKLIYFFVTITLLSVIIFPLSIVALGSLVTIIVYLIVFSFLTYYLIKLSNGYYALSTNNLKNTNIEIMSLDTNVNGFLEDNKLTNTQLNNVDNISFDNLEENKSNNEKNDSLELIEEKEKQTDIVSNDLIIDETIKNTKEIININNEFKQEELIETETNEIVIETIENIDPTINEEITLLHHIEPEVHKEIDQENVDMIEIVEKVEETTEPQNILEEIKYNKYNENEPIFIYSDNSNNELKLTDTQKVNTDIVEDKNFDDKKTKEKINAILDKAFEFKATSDLIKASEEFYVVWNLTKDIELKYLLTIELAEIYKELGDYRKADEIISAFLELPNKNQFNNNILYEMKNIIILTEQELDRLGISNLPISKIPRLVRIKVSEKMNMLDS